MRLIATMSLVGLAACSSAQTNPVAESYSLMLKADGQTWCGYTSPVEFQTEVTKVRPTESARITYSADKLSELTYQVEAESGDWVVVDKYTPTDGRIDFRRANLLAQENLQVIQEAAIRANSIGPLHTVRVSTLDGTAAVLPPNLDFPQVSIRADLSAAPFVQVSGEMRSRSVERLCKKTD